MPFSVLMVGPFPNPIHGCSLANQVLERGLYKKNVKTYRINMATNFSEELGSFSLKKLFAAVKQYFSLYKVFKVNVVYLTPGQSFFGVLKYAPFLLLSSFLGKQIIFHVHGNHLWKEFDQASKIKKKIMHFLISLSTKGIVLSDSLRKNLTPFLPENKIQSVHNFAEDYLHNPSIDKKFDNLNIVYLSNLMTEKGIFDLLEALKYLQKYKVNFRAKLAGGIDSKTETQAFDAIQELGDAVEYLGLVKGEKKKNC